MPTLWAPQERFSARRMCQVELCHLSHPVLFLSRTPCHPLCRVVSSPVVLACPPSLLALSPLAQVFVTLSLCVTTCEFLDELLCAAVSTRAPRIPGTPANQLGL